MTQMPSPDARCCPSMDLQWTQRILEDQYADVQFCASCGRVHRTEKYPVALRFPSTDRCVNCGGDLLASDPAAAAQSYEAEDVYCSQCALNAAADKALHDKLASILPGGSYLEAAGALVQSQRYVLALKLATAETRWGEARIEGELLRLEILEAMNEFDRALDEAYEWSEREGCPPVVWGTIAELEASAGDLARALAALERGLSLQPDRFDWWLDYADLNAHLDDRPNAVRAAAKALHSPTTVTRALSVLAEIGERYYAGGQYAEALSACSIANEKQQQHAGIAWLRARIAAANQDQAYLVKWLEITVALDPSHTQAQEMLTPYRRKRSWFAW